MSCCDWCLALLQLWESWSPGCKMSQLLLFLGCQGREHNQAFILTLHHPVHKIFLALLISWLVTIWPNCSCITSIILTYLVTVPHHICGITYLNGVYWSQLWSLVTIVTLMPWCGHNCVTKCNYGEECDQPASGDTNTEIEVINQLELNHCITDTVAVQNQSWQTWAERKSLNRFWPQ